MSKDVYLSFAMIVQDEANRIRPTLENIKDVGDEIVIIDGGSQDDTVEICKEYTDKVYEKKFTYDFAKQKNFADFKCNGRWIFSIDADERLNDRLREELVDILHNNEATDLFYVARRNIVNGVKEEDINKWNWDVDADGDINYPDWQSRIYKSSGLLHWKGRVHETVVGFDNYAKLPADKIDGYYLIHEKNVDKQRQQNKLYNSLER